ELGDGHAIASVAQLRIAGEISVEDDFVETVHKSGSAGGQSGDRRFLFGLWSLAEHDAKDIIIHGKTTAQLRDVARLNFENHAHVKTAVDFFVGNTGELALVHFLNRLNFAPGMSNFFGELVDQILQVLFFTGRVQYEQTFVFFHFSSFFSGASTAPLN